MAHIISFSNANRIQDIFSEGPAGSQAGAVAEGLFGGILLDTQPVFQEQSYAEHFESVFDDLSLTHIRYPDGELPDGFAVKSQNGPWAFKHNQLNGGTGDVADPLTAATLGPSDVDAAYLASLTPAMSLDYPDLLNPDLLAQGRLGFSGALAMAVEKQASFSLVLPEFQYLRPAVHRTTHATFDPNRHVKLNDLKSDVETFLDDLFLNGKYNDGVVPSDFILEIGNEDGFGWNATLFGQDRSNDVDSYTAYLYGVLLGVTSFRARNPNIEFQVSMQTTGVGKLAHIEADFSKIGAMSLFHQVDMLGLDHGNSLNATLETGGIFEGHSFDWHNKGVENWLALIGDPTGSTTHLYASAWSADSRDVLGPVDRDANGRLTREEKDAANFQMPAAGAALALFSSMVEFGVDYAANWGIGSYDGFGTLLSAEDESGTVISPYGQVLGLMAQSLPGSQQLGTSTIDGDRSEDVITYAYETDSKGVLFFAANEFTGTKSYDLASFGAVTGITVNRVSEDGLGSGGVTLTGNSLIVSFNAPYEIVQVTVSRNGSGDGNLSIEGGGGADRITGGLHDDTLKGHNGDDTLQGLGGDDRIYGSGGADRIFGGTGHDWIDAGHGDDLVRGGDDQDRVQLGAGNDVFHDTPQTGRDAGDTVYGGTGNDRINGGGGDDRYIGGEGHDFIVGGAGNDVLYGDRGYDELHGNGGNDIIYGGNGRDIVYMGYGNDVFHDSAQNDDHGVDTVYGGFGQDTVWGSGGADTVYGGAGADRLHGGLSDDRIRGDEDNDLIWGDAGNDRLWGDAGNDTLNGGAEIDTLTGGAGRDVFVFEESGTGWNERITDFAVGQDRLRILIDGVNDLSDLYMFASGDEFRIQFKDNGTGPYVHQGSIILEGSFSYAQIHDAQNFDFT